MMDFARCNFCGSILLHCNDDECECPICNTKVKKEDLTMAVKKENTVKKKKKKKSKK